MDSKNATLIPLLRDTNDAYYRYKMPKLAAKLEGSGNGIKTVITNMVAIAKALGRPPSYPTKFFGCELGAQVKMDQGFVVNGAHDADKLQKLLYNFIDKFVLCSNCNNPETSLKVVGKTITQACISCGHQTTIPNTHKLTAYIINYPPNEGSSLPSSSAASASKTVKSKKEKGSSKSKKNGGTRSPTSSDDKEADANGNGHNKENNNNDDFDDDFGEVDLSTDIHLNQLTTGVNGLYVADPVERANTFYRMVKEKKEKLGEVNVQKDLLSEAIRLGLREKATLLLSEVLFTDNLLEELKTHRVLLIRFCAECKKAQKYLLGGFEKLVGEIYKEKLLDKVPIILKAFYDNDILEEEVLIEWSEKPSKKYVSKDISRIIHEKAEPFIKWLKEAEVEDDSEEEEGSPSTNNVGNKNNSEDDDIDIEYSYRATGLTVEAASKDEGGEDINIDDI